ncbi:MAG: hypothetical protein QM683_03725 [Lacrimispora sp.]
MIKAGAGKAEISLPQSIFPIEDYSGVHDELMARVLILESDILFVLAVLDLTSLRDYGLEELRELIGEKTGAEKEHIWICVSHTFTAPHLRSEEALRRGAEDVVRKNCILMESLKDGLRKALKQAMENLRPVSMDYGLGYCPVNVNRDVPTKEGWWLGTNWNGFSNKSLPVLRFDRQDGRTAALVYSCDVQSSVMEQSFLKDGTRLISGDLAGTASRFLEESRDGDFAALFVTGAAGDQAPILQAEKKDYHDPGGGFSLLHALSAALSSQADLAADKAIPVTWDGSIYIKYDLCQCQGQKGFKNPKDIRPAAHYQYEPDGYRTVSIGILCLGDAAIVGLAPELSSITAEEIRSKSPFPFTMVFTMVNGAEKYMPEKTAYDRITYEAMNSSFAQGSAEKLADRIKELLLEARREQEERRKST